MRTHTQTLCISLHPAPRNLDAHFDKVIVRIFVRLPQLVAVPRLELVDRVCVWRFVHVHAGAVLALDARDQLERLLEMVQGVDKDHGHEVSRRLASLRDTRHHVGRRESGQAKRRRLPQAGAQVVNGPREDLLRRRVLELGVVLAQSRNVERCCCIVDN